MAAHSEPGAASLAAGRAILQPRPHGRARQAQQQGHLLWRQHLFYRPLFRVRALPKRTETDSARLAAPGCSRLARRSWPAHRVARHDPSSTASSPCCPSSRAVCARSDCPWPRLARLTARDARRSLAQIAWSRSLAHSSSFRGGGADLLTRLTAGAPAQASSGGICPRRFRAAPRPCAPLTAPTFQGSVFLPYVPYVPLCTLMYPYVPLCTLMYLRSRALDRSCGQRLAAWVDLSLAMELSPQSALAELRRRNRAENRRKRAIAAALADGKLTLRSELS